MVEQLGAARCSFCGLRRSEVDALAVGMDGAAICTACAELAAGIVDPPVHHREIVYRGLSSVVTNDPRIGPDFGTIDDAAIVVRNDHVAWIGSERDLPMRYREYPEIECEGRMAVPGFVDAGTELLGGVPDHRPDPDEMIGTAASAMRVALAHGVTMLDVRAGGSGDATVDAVLLAAARAASDLADPQRIGITWVAGRRADANFLVDVMAPTVGRIASAVELSCSGGDGVDLLARQLASLHRLPVRVRLCEIDPDASAALAEGALTVESERWSVLPPDVTPVLEPLSLLDGVPVDARSVWDAGGRPAIATRSNPDGRSVAGMTLAITLAVGLCGLTIGEALWAATRGGALALGDSERGRLRVTDPADFVVLDTHDPVTLVRNPDTNPVWRVVVNGQQVAV